MSDRNPGDDEPPPKITRTSTPVWAAQESSQLDFSDLDIPEETTPMAVDQSFDAFLSDISSIDSGYRTRVDSTLSMQSTPASTSSGVTDSSAGSAAQPSVDITAAEILADINLLPDDFFADPGLQVIPLPAEVQQYYASSASQNQFRDLDDTDYTSAYNHTNRFIFSARIGSGTFGGVYRAVRYEAQAEPPLAIKVVKPGQNATQVVQVRNEVKLSYVLRERLHRNITQFHDYFTNVGNTRYYLVSELSPIGDIFKTLILPDSEGHWVWHPLKAYICRHLIRGIAEGVRHLHGLGIIHGDIKLENILLFPEETANEDQFDRFERLMRMRPKLTDFSNSLHFKPGVPPLVYGPICSISTAAPESYFNPDPYNGKTADYFSVGACMLAMLIGAHPYAPSFPYPDPPNSADNYNRFSTQLKIDRRFTEQLCQPFHYDLRQLLVRMLEPVPENRLTINQFLADNWFRTQRRVRSRSLDDSTDRLDDPAHRWKKYSSNRFGIR